MKRRPPSDPHRRRDDEDAVRIGGWPAVAALFSRDPARVLRLFFVPDMAEHAKDACRILAAARKPFREVGGEELAKVAGSAMHGGIVAIAKPKPVLPFDPALATASAAKVPLLLALDGIGNPQNLGAIARTAAFFGIDRLVLSDHPGQAGPSGAAYRIAEGGLEWVDLYRARNLPLVLKRLKPSYLVLGTALEKGKPLSAIPRDRPIVLILGNEVEGLPAPTLAACDEVVTLAGSGRVQSLNVAATAAVLIHALAAR